MLRREECSVQKKCRRRGWERVRKRAGCRVHSEQGTSGSGGLWGGGWHPAGAAYGKAGVDFIAGAMRIRERLEAGT